MRQQGPCEGTAIPTPCPPAAPTCSFRLSLAGGRRPDHALPSRPLRGGAVSAPEDQVQGAHLHDPPDQGHLPFAPEGLCKAGEGGTTCSQVHWTSPVCEFVHLT